MEREEITQLKTRVKYEITKVIKGDLDDVENWLNKGDAKRALSDLDSAVTKLKRLANSL